MRCAESSSRTGFIAPAAVPDVVRDPAVDRQTRSRVLQTKKRKAATTPIRISIQFWPSNPRIVKRSTRNCTAPALPFLGRISILLVQDRCFGSVNILFFYVFRVGSRRLINPCRASRGALGACRNIVTPAARGPVEIASGRVTFSSPAHRAGCKSLLRAKRGAERQQLVELGGGVADTVRRGDGDLPTFFGERSSFGDRHHNAQPNRRRGFLTS
jgi:hypothetical protein